MPNNAINSDSEKRGDECAQLFTVGYGDVMLQNQIGDKS